MLVVPAGCWLVALRKESVDRNNGVHYDNYNLHWSLSARRAWIEIFTGSYHPHFHVSLSARRAWIEISVCFVCVGFPFPSLSARRAWIEIKTGSSVP